MNNSVKQTSEDLPLTSTILLNVPCDKTITIGPRTRGHCCAVTTILDVESSYKILKTWNRSAHSARRGCNPFRPRRLNSSVILSLKKCLCKVLKCTHSTTKLLWFLYYSLVSFFNQRCQCQPLTFIVSFYKGTKTGFTCCSGLMMSK